MVIYDAIAAELPFLRREAEARMSSRVTLRRRTGHAIQDEDNGLEFPDWEVLHTDVPFRLGGADAGDSATRRRDIGGVEIQTAVRIGHLPVAIDDLIDGDFIDITAGENAGRVFSIVEVDWKDQATARRVPLLAQDRPEEWA